MVFFVKLTVYLVYLYAEPIKKTLQFCMSFKELSSAHQGCIYFINTVKKKKKP